jgi:isoprenylcysteine carboxyl methyltransferase (ICMT) family protein YpbQ
MNNSLASILGLIYVVSELGLALLVVGPAIRCYSIIHLGRFFTVNVAIAATHRLVPAIY